MARIKTISYSMPRGDTRALSIGLPINTYTTGCHLLFTMKPIPDVLGASNDSTAVVQKSLSDSNIVSTDTINKNYILTLNPADTNSVTPGTYRAEIEYVSGDGTVVLSYPDPSVSLFEITITGDVTRRTS